MPGVFGLLIDGIIIVLLVFTLPLVLRLERRLAGLRQDRGALDAGAAGLTEATRLADAAAIRLRASAEAGGRQLAESLGKAEPLRDDLKYLMERAETLADRLEGLVRTARPMATEIPPTAPSAPASQAERDLLRALLKGIPGSAP